MLATAAAATLLGIDGQRVVVEVHSTNGLPTFNVVGLPDASCREARDRVRAAIQSSGVRWPSARITVNLAPSGVRKSGAGLDLAIALGVIAAATDSLDPADLGGHGFVGELGLDGTLRNVAGMLSHVAALAEDTRVVVPASGFHEAALVRDHGLIACRTLGQVIAALAGRDAWPEPPDRPCRGAPVAAPDLADVAGHPVARQAVEIAAAGGHNLLLVGPPGTGKSMLARRLPGLLPELDHDTAMMATRIHSVAGLSLPENGLVTAAPFRAPHHSASMAAMIGGGSGRFRPGEVSCAHGGVLFLDELGEFSPRVLDALRQPLEDRRVRISRAHGSVVFPADVTLVAAMNPCPCGLLGSTETCRCSEVARLRYARRLSGPLLDRIDLRVHMQRPTAAQLMTAEPGESSAAVAQRVQRARRHASERGLVANARTPDERLDEVAPIDNEARVLLHAALADGRLSARGLVRVRLVARTIADLADEPEIGAGAVATALALRSRPVVFEGCGVGHG